MPRDFTKYNLGVHTDTVGKLMSFLFYIPKDNTLSNIGTSLYKPISKIDSDTKQNLIEDQHFTEDQTKKNFKRKYFSVHKRLEFIIENLTRI